MIKVIQENDYSETDEFTLIKEMNHWINDLKEFFVDDSKAQKVIADYFYYDDGKHQEDFEELQSSVKTLQRLWKKLNAIVENAEEKEYKKSKNEGYRLKEQSANIEVENPGILEVPEGKNVEDLPIKHFVELANKKGLATITRALNNLQVWNKNKNPKLSKWAGDMIDKVGKRFENQKKNESLSITEFSSNFDGTEIDEVEFYSDDLTKFSDEKRIIASIEAGCTYPINIYNVDFELSHNIVITYEVPEEYYNPDVIESDIIGILERLEDKIRGAKPAWVKESKNCNITEDYKDDLKKFADANMDKLKSIANRCGYKFYNDSYYKETKTGNNSIDYATALCYDFYEIPMQDGDMNKFDKELYKYFKKFDFRYILDDLPNRKTLCIYY